MPASPELSKTTYACTKRNSNQTHACSTNRVMHAATHMNDCIHTTDCTCMHACIRASSSTSSDVVFMRSSPIPAPKVSRLAMSTGQYVTHAPSGSRKNAANVSAMNELQTQKKCQKLSRHFCWKTQTKMSTFFFCALLRVFVLVLHFFAPVSRGACGRKILRRTTFAQYCAKAFRHHPLSATIRLYSFRSCKSHVVSFSNSIRNRLIVPNQLSGILVFSWSIIYTNTLAMSASDQGSLSSRIWNNSLSERASLVSIFFLTSTLHI